MTDEMNQLEHKHMLSYGTILAMDTMIRVLIEAHPDKERVKALLGPFQARTMKLMEKQIMLVDDISPNVAAAHEQYGRMLKDYRSTLGV